MHARRSGVADHYALDDRHALAIVRQIVDRSRPGAAAVDPDRRSRSSRCIRPPSWSGSCRSISAGNTIARALIARLVDGSDFSEFKALYGETLVTGFAAIHGMRVGILANNGILFSESALKGAHFIELCCQRKIPLLFLQNITGFMVGKPTTRRAASPRTAPSSSPRSPAPRCRKSR